MITAFLDVFRAWKFMKKNKLGKFLNYSILINLSILILVIVGAYFLSSFLSSWLIGMLHYEWISWIVNIIVFVLLGFVYYKIYTVMVLTITAPILANLAEETNKILIQQYGTTDTQTSFPLEAWRTIIENLKIGLRELVFIVVMFGISMLPVANIVAIISLFVVSAYSVGLGMLDYYNEFIGLTPKESKRSIRKNKFSAVGNGLAYNILVLIPIVGVLLAPALATIGGCMTMSQIHSKNAQPIKTS